MMLSCGDALIDFLPVKSVDGREALAPVVGGSCLNVAVGLARLGASTGFVGGVSRDMFGRMIADHAEASGVSLRFAERSERPTTLAFVRQVGGEARYAFYDEATAARAWTWHRGSIPFAEVDAVHIGSTTLANAEGSAQAMALLDDASPATTISFDPNCRDSLVHDRADYLRRMDAIAAHADIIRLSDGDFAYLYGGQSHAAQAARQMAGRTSLFVVTRGARGVEAWHRRAGRLMVDAPAVKVVDAIGAGDSFSAGLLFGLRAVGCIAPGALSAMEADALRRVLAFAVACAGITCSRAGADPPRLSEVPASALLERRVTSSRRSAL